MVFMDKNKKVLFEYASKLLKMFDKMYDKENAFKILFIPENKEYSLDEINKWDKNSRIVEWIDLRRENSYPGEPLEDLQPRDISIFAINPHEPEEIYLTWDGDSEEPRLWHYFGAEFYTFNSFERFLLYINKIIGDEDTKRQTI